MPIVRTGTDGPDSFTGADDDEIFHMGDAHDVVDANGGNDTVFGEGGDDWLTGGHGDDSLDGGEGDDWLLGGSINVTGTDTADGGAGNDIITAAGASGTFIGGSGTDRLEWLSISADPVLLGITSDSQPGHFEGFYQFMGTGPGTIVVDGIEQIHASTGAGDDTLSGGDLDDALQAWQGTNLLHGGGGNDTLSYSTGWASTLDGGDGDDTALVRVGALGDIVLTVAPDGSASDNHGATMTNFERFSLAFAAGNDHAQLGAGSDTVYAGHGGDTIRGGGGIDVMNGQWGADSLDGEGGTDSIFGGQHDDTIAGGEGADTLRGGAQNDALAGGGDGDWLDGGTGNDDLAGDAGDDTLLGGEGDDTITGGLGADVMNGNAGNDVFRFLAPADSSPVAPGRDEIRGFAPGDRIDLSAIDANGALAGDPPFDFIGTAAFTAPGQVRVQEVNGNTIVQINTIGNGVADMAIRLIGPHTLVAGDFLL